MNIRLQYAVKFVCGVSNGRILAPGTYWTAINVHNPGYTRVAFRKKIAIAFPGEKPGPVSKFFEARLGPDEALEIDCDDIRNHANSKDEFLKGFVVIESGAELDVVAVYTAAGKREEVETLHMERVSPRRIQVGQPDLIPVPDANGGFCRQTERGELIVTVLNQGTAAAGPSTTEVDFYKYGKVTVPTPSLAAGASVDLIFPIPYGSFDADCEFKITADLGNVVAENNEGNNIALGVCVG